MSKLNVFSYKKNRLLNLFTLTPYKTISKNNKSSAPSISRQAPKNTIVIFTAPNGLKSKATPTIIKRIPIVRSLPQPIASNTRRSSALWILLIPSSISTTPSRNGKNDTTVCGVIRQNMPSAIKDHTEDQFALCLTFPALEHMQKSVCRRNHAAAITDRPHTGIRLQHQKQSQKDIACCLEESVLLLSYFP